MVDSWIRRDVLSNEVLSLSHDLPSMRTIKHGDMLGREVGEPHVDLPMHKVAKRCE